MAITKANVLAALLLLLAAPPAAQAVTLDTDSDWIWGEKSSQGKLLDMRKKATRLASLSDFSNKSCECLPWKDVYAKGVGCGSGMELAHFDIEFKKHAQEVARPEEFKKFCQDFFMRSAHKSCYNMNIGSSNKQWCFYPAKCDKKQKLDARKVEFHECSAEKGDSLMRSKTPVELSKMAMADGLDPNTMTKFSYDLSPKDWTDVEGAADLTELQSKMSHTFKFAKVAEVTDSVRQEFKKVVESGTPTIFRNTVGSPSGTVVVGKKIYGFEELQGVLTYVCIKGCK